VFPLAIAAANKNWQPRIFLKPRIGERQLALVKH
jgi:hypothetical protein